MPQPTALSHWLRLLWGRAPALQLDAERPFISAGTIHLPAEDDWPAQRAAAAHAAAHLTYSPAHFECADLVPVARALLGLLEDARVESLASRELPGLRRLWHLRHQAGAHDGNSAESLLNRLARALADPAYRDPHPWVQKGRQLLFLDAAQQVLALHHPEELRQAACLLGHDIGQMRLPFNAKTYRPAPVYRDDHRWMWPADDLVPMQRLPSPTSTDSDGGAAPPPLVETTSASFRHPEWDRLIGRLRHDWCTVIETPAPPVPDDSHDHGVEIGRGLQHALRALVHPPRRWERHNDGETFHLDALVHWAVSHRLRLPTDARVHLKRPRRQPPGTVWLLVDQSASTMTALGDGEASVFETASQSAAAMATAFQAMGIGCVVAGFHSEGRHAVHLQFAKHLDGATGATLMRYLQALMPRGSTRLGAVLRHATQRLASQRGPRWVILLSDGEPHDIDVHDPRYLAEDARHAVWEAAQRAVRVACLAFAPDAHVPARRIFGMAKTQTVASLDQLPRALRRLLV